MAKAKSEKVQTGCRLCKYRVAPKKGPNGEPVPTCCFNYEVNDKESMTHCPMFTEGNFYINHPDEP